MMSLLWLVARIAGDGVERSLPYTLITCQGNRGHAIPVIVQHCYGQASPVVAYARYGQSQGLKPVVLSAILPYTWISYWKAHEGAGSPPSSPQCAPKAATSIWPLNPRIALTAPLHSHPLSPSAHLPHHRRALPRQRPQPSQHLAHVATGGPALAARQQCADGRKGSAAVAAPHTVHQRIPGLTSGVAGAGSSKAGSRGPGTEA